MPVTIRIPTPLRNLTNGQETITANGASVKAVLDEVQANFPGLKERLYDANGSLRRFVNVFLNGEDIRFAQGPATAVKDGDELSIIPAIAGGRSGR
jgi:molybdopterin synthase sulfur carrier subunit